MISFVCFKWHADGYRSKFDGAHVNALRDMVAKHYPDPHRFICITDNAEGIADGIEIVPLWDEHADIPNPSFRTGPSCYRRLKVFSRDFGRVAGERFVCLDLDVVITGDLRPLVDRDEDFVAWKDPGNKWPYNGSMFMLRAGSRPQVWENFNPETSPKEAHAAGCRGSDQGWISYVLGDGEATWGAQDGLYSYSMQLNGGNATLPKNARVVLFHGDVDPWSKEAQRHKWVKENYPKNKVATQKQGASFKSLIGKQKGKTICVMGGSGTLSRDIDGLKADIWISANEHGAKLRKADYVVAMDEIHGTKQIPMSQVVREFTKAPIIGPYSHCDFILPDWPGHPKRILSGVMAMWIAHCMGAKEVILAGMDAYDGKHSALQAYRDMADHIKTLVTVCGDGPLSVIFPPNKEFESRYPDPVLAALASNQDDVITVEVRKPTNHNGEQVKKGGTLTGTRFELRRLLKHKMVVEVANGAHN